MAQVAERPEFQHILEEVNSYNVERYEALMRALKRLHPGHRNLPEEEQKIVQRLKEGGPSRLVINRVKEIYALQSKRGLTAIEREELDLFLKEMEPWQLERAKLLVQLVKRWGVNIDEVHRRLGTPIDDLVYG